MAQQNPPPTHELPPINIEGNPDLRIGWGGGGGGWGLSSGPRRGEGGTGRFTGPAIPGFKTVIIEEHVAMSAMVDSEFQPRYATLNNSIQTQLHDAKTQAAQSATTDVQRASLEYLGLEKFIEQKQSEYNQQTTLAYSFWGTSPFYKPSFFLAHSAQEAAKRGKFDNFFADYIHAYGAAHESRIIDQTLEAALAHLGAAANAIDQREDLSTLDHSGKTKVLAEKARRIRVEQQAHFHILPSVLQAEVIKWSGHIQDMPAAEALKNYQVVLQNLINNQNASIHPYSRANPKINTPLTRAELEALASLVEGQGTGIIGPRWKDYHTALMHREYARHMQNTLTAFSALQKRAEQLERQLEQANAIEAARLLLEKEALETAKRVEAERKARITYTSTASATTLPFLAPMGNGAFNLSPAAYGALQSAVRLAIPALRVAALVSGPVLIATVVVGAIVILWPKDDERQTALSIPLADLSPPEGLDLTASTVDLPYVPITLDDDEQSTLLIAATPDASPIARVPVVAAQFDAQQQVYSVALEHPQRILTWTPAKAPGTESPGITPLPEHRPEGSVYEGASLTPVQAQVEGYPALDLIDQDRIIITFPADSGMAPILVMFKDRRMEPGRVTGRGELTEGIWLGEAARGGGAAIPAQIADLLRGRDFKNFNEFRAAFWRAVANDELLSKQFSGENLKRMRKDGHSPTSRKQDHHKSHKKFILHHVNPIAKGGSVYDLDNIRVVTPASHQQIHYGDKP